MNPSLATEIERATGKSIKSLQAMPIAERRRVIESERGKCIVFTRNFPFIGRGNVLGDQTLSHAQVDDQFREVLG